MSDSIKDKYMAHPEYHAARARESIGGDLLLLERQYRKLNLSAVFSSIAGAHENLGLLAYFVRNDSAALKQHWHIASKLACHAARHVPDSDSYTTGGYMTREHQLLYALVSDSQSAIDEVATLETYRLLKFRDDPRAREYSFHLAQLILRSDYEAAQAKIERGAKKAGGQLKQAYATGADFYSLLMKGDKAGLESSITDYIKIDRKDTLPTICDFVYPIVTFRTKLCWQKGIPVEIDHPMLPMAWMPVSPLARYDDIYDFFAPDWIPPDQRLFSRIARKFRRDYPVVDACIERVKSIDAYNKR